MLSAECRKLSALSADVDHRARSGNEARLADMMALFLVIDRLANECGQLFIAGAVAHERREIMLAHREQAGADLAVGGDANAAAVSAEGVRHRSDDADLADAVLE